MNFQGHQLYKLDSIGAQWVFDLTTFRGYKVKINDDGKVVGIREAFIIERNNDNGAYIFIKNIKDIPAKIMRKSTNIIDRYRKEALLDRE